MLLEIEGIELPMAHLFRSQGYRKLTDTLTATFAGFVMRDSRDKESDVGDIYAVTGEADAAGNYFVETIRHHKAVTQAFVSEARKISVPLPDRGQTGVYYLNELKLPPERRKREQLDPSSPLYRALVKGISAAYPTSTLDVK